MDEYGFSPFIPWENNERFKSFAAHESWLIKTTTPIRIMFIFMDNTLTAVLYSREADIPNRYNVTAIMRGLKMFYVRDISSLDREALEKLYFPVIKVAD